MSSEKSLREQQNFQFEKIRPIKINSQNRLTKPIRRGCPPLVNNKKCFISSNYLSEGKSQHSR